MDLSPFRFPVVLLLEEEDCLGMEIKGCESRMTSQHFTSSASMVRVPGLQPDEQMGAGVMDPLILACRPRYLNPKRV